MNSDVKTWLIGWFKDNAGLKEEEVQNSVGINYFEKGWIDSFKFITFITEAEEKFNIRFSNDEFQDRTFSTIEGLTDIIQRRMSER